MPHKWKTLKVISMKEVGFDGAAIWVIVNKRKKSTFFISLVNIKLYCIMAFHDSFLVVTVGSSYVYRKGYRIC